MPADLTTAAAVRLEAFVFWIHAEAVRDPAWVLRMAALAVKLVAVPERTTAFA